MKGRQIGPNCYEVSVDIGGNPAAVLFSYGVPVGAFIPQKGDSTLSPWIRTAQQWSVTTSRHISAWAGNKDLRHAPQTLFDCLQFTAESFRALDGMAFPPIQPRGGK